ncbi:SymE family type I addiction module toxin [Pantoea sp. BAV 3049]|nr:SymE family type I addiction module toxin [Pantoea sp. BAV 3049]
MNLSWLANIAGEWLAEVGFEMGTGMIVKVLDGCVVLPPCSRLWS